MAVIKKIGIKNSSGTGYDSRDIGAEAENIVVSYDSSGNISDTSDVSTTGTLKDALTSIKETADGAAPKSHASSTSEYGVASTSDYGHVKINANSGLTVTDGAIGVNFSDDGSAADTTAVVRANDSRLSNKRNNVNAITFSNNLSTPTTKSYDGSSTLTVTYSDVGAAPTSHAFNTTTYGAATSELYGHVKPGTGLEIASSSPGVLNVSYGTTSDTACAGNDSRLSNARVPETHAATDLSYGGGTSSSYGHVKLTDNYSIDPDESVYGQEHSIAASAYALQQAYSELSGNFTYYSSEDTFTYGSRNTTWYFQRYGRIASLKCLGIYTFSSAGSYTLSGTIKEGFRPTGRCAFPIVNVAASKATGVSRLFLTAEGVITIITGTTGDQEYMCTATYVCEARLPDVT